MLTGSLQAVESTHWYIMVQINSLPRSTCTAEPLEKKLRVRSSNHDFMNMKLQLMRREGRNALLTSFEPLSLPLPLLSRSIPRANHESKSSSRVAAPTSLPLAMVFWHGTSDFIWIEGRLATPAAEDSGVDVDPKSGG